jgi:hypothetical protein
MTAMTTIIIVEKTGTLKELKIKNFKEEDLYKKCNYRKNIDFEKRTIWNKKDFKVELWAKNDGKANMENKYDFPPPVDNDLFFGSCALVAYKNKQLVDLTKETWSKMYEYLFGGFEDLSVTAQEDFEEQDELDDVHPSLKTKAGYLKDGFIVDTNSEEEDMEENSESEEEESVSEVENSEDEENSDGEMSEYSEEESDEEGSDSELSKEDYCYSDED